MRWKRKKRWMGRPPRLVGRTKTMRPQLGNDNVEVQAGGDEGSNNVDGTTTTNGVQDTAHHDPSIQID